jgi:hypothetical protein
MRLSFLIACSFATSCAWSSSCCVSNTSIPNLMILPSDWQQTFSVSQTRVIGDVDDKGRSTFRNQDNKEMTQAARMDLAYGWNFRYQTGVSVKYQNKNREFAGQEDQDSGWSDVGLSQAYAPKMFDRLWIFHTVNLPTANSVYNSRSSMAVDAQGSGTYFTGLGFFKIHNYKNGDLTFGGEAHRSFGRTFRSGEDETSLDPFWGGSLSIGGGWVPWKSKGRLGIILTPRMEGPKTGTHNDDDIKGKQSLVWDSVINGTYSFNAQYAAGVSYLDQTLVGPVSNTLLVRSFSFLFQSRF